MNRITVSVGNDALETLDDVVDDSSLPPENRSAALRFVLEDVDVDELRESSERRDGPVDADGRHEVDVELLGAALFGVDAVRDDRERHDSRTEQTAQEVRPPKEDEER